MKIVNLFGEQKLLVKIVLALGFVLILGGAVAYFTPCSDNKSCFASVSEALLGTSSSVEKEEILPQVFLINVGDFQKNNLAIATLGQVETSDQVEITSQISGKIRSVNVQIGQQVLAGQILAVFENDSALAQMQQAEAGLEAAKAQLAETEKGARPEQLKIAKDQADSAKIGLEFAKTNLENTKQKTKFDLDNAYSSARNILISSADAGENAIINATVLQYRYFNDNTLDSVNLLEKKGQAIYKLLGVQNAGRWDVRAVSEARGGAFGSAVNASSQEEIDSALSNMENALRSVKEMLNAILIYKLNASDQSLLNLDKNSINGQLTAVSGIKGGIAVQRAGISSLILAAEINLNQAKSAADQAQNQLDLLLAGATHEQLDIQKSAVKSAEAFLIQARDVYNKTVIVSPISGRIGSTGVKESESANPGELIASVVNDTGFQVISYVDSSNLSKIRPGNSVLIEDNVKGIVTNVSPSVDPIKKKVEVKISILDQNQNMVAGQFVNLSISINEESIGNNVYLLPLSAVKVTSDRSFVFQVKDGVVVEKEVQLGNVVGESVEVLGGIDSFSDIVLSVRGLQTGQKVKV